MSVKTQIEFTYSVIGEADEIMYVQGDVRFKLITVKDAAIELHYSERYIQELCERGTLIAIRPLNQYLIFDFSLKLFVQARDNP